MVETEQAKILWDFQILTCKMVVTDQPDIVVVVKDVAILSDSNIRKKEREKLEKYQGQKKRAEKSGERRQLWSQW